MIIGIADLGIGNFAAMAKMLNQLGVEARRIDDPAAMASVDRLVLPGVGAFDYATRVLDDLHWRGPLLDVMHEGIKPVLAVCVGMQLLTDSSDEGPGVGLGWIPGTCRRFTPDPTTGLKVPHMGWSDIAPTRDDLVIGSEVNQRYYFVHSYYVECSAEHIIATCDYGLPFAAAVRRERVWGVQFHPEKSHRFGLELLRRFVEAPC